MFDRVSDALNGAFKKLSGKGKITEDNVREAMGEVRASLLEADVHYDVVEEFIEAVLKDAVGREVTKSLKPGQEMIGIVNRRLVELLGGDPDSEPEAPAASGSGIMKVSPGPTVVMMCGLQGSGKTTTCGKLATLLKKEGRRVLLAAADLQRPAAVEQLETVASQANAEGAGTGEISFYGEKDKAAEYGKAVGVAVKVCENAIRHARNNGYDTVILDTAGRLHINNELMGELHAVRKSTSPHHIFLVVDAMTGQDAVTSAKAFHERLEVDGVILTKLDSDTRGGAALSVKKVTGAQIRYAGTGERVDAIEPFHAHRMAGRILGMGDVLTLVEKAQAEVTEEEAKQLEAKMAKGEFGMDDFLKQLKSLRRMGPLRQIMGLVPGAGAALKDAQIDEKQLDRVEAQINSMTPTERARPDLINVPRRRRIAAGSGAQQEEIGRLVKQFSAISKMTQQMASMTAADKVNAVKQMQAAGGGSALPGMTGMPGFMKTKGSTQAKPRGVKRRPGKKGKKRR